MNIVRKINEIFALTKEKDAEGAEVWIVSWYARYGEFSSDKNQVAKVFLNEQDADAFIKSLKDAQTLLQYTESIMITKEKQR